MSEPITAPLYNQVRELAECATAARRAFADVALTGFEQTLDNVVEYERRVADVIDLDWLKEVVVVRGAFINEFKTAYLRLAHAVLA